MLTRILRWWRKRTGSNDGGRIAVSPSKREFPEELLNPTFAAVRTRPATAVVHKVVVVVANAVIDGERAVTIVTDWPRCSKTVR